MSTVITSIDRRSPAARAGVRAGERLISIGGHPIADVLDYRFFGYDANPLLGLEGAVGVHPINRGGLLVSKRHYLQQREMMEGKTWDNKDGFFPAPLWVWVYGTASDSGKPAIQTQGLQDFGLPELGFFDPQREVGELLDLLYSMSCLQITGKQLYRNMALIPLDEKTEVVCKQEGGILFFIGA